jgi:hypothetical protein
MVMGHHLKSLKKTTKTVKHDKYMPNKVWKPVIVSQATNTVPVKNNSNNYKAKNGQQKAAWATQKSALNKAAPGFKEQKVGKGRPDEERGHANVSKWKKKTKSDLVNEAIIDDQLREAGNKDAFKEIEIMQREEEGSGDDSAESSEENPFISRINGHLKQQLENLELQWVEEFAPPEGFNSGLFLGCFKRDHYRLRTLKVLRRFRYEPDEDMRTDFSKGAALLHGNAEYYEVEHSSYVLIVPYFERLWTAIGSDYKNHMVLANEAVSTDRFLISYEMLTQAFLPKNTNLSLSQQEVRTRIQNSINNIATVNMDRDVEVLHNVSTDTTAIATYFSDYHRAISSSWDFQSPPNLEEKSSAVTGPVKSAFRPSHRLSEMSRSGVIFPQQFWTNKLLTSAAVSALKATLVPNQRRTITHPSSMVCVKGLPMIHPFQKKASAKDYIASFLIGLGLILYPWIRIPIFLWKLGSKRLTIQNQGKTSLEESMLTQSDSIHHESEILGSSKVSSSQKHMASISIPDLSIRETTHSSAWSDQSSNKSNCASSSLSGSSSESLEESE